ncbi:hypothetical protein QTP88_024471 [Uroleucon formosanum]
MSGVNYYYYTPAVVYLFIPNNDDSPLKPTPVNRGELDFRGGEDCRRAEVGGSAHRVPPSEVETAVYNCSRWRAVRLRKGPLGRTGRIAVWFEGIYRPTDKRAISVRKITPASNGFIILTS